MFDDESVSKSRSQSQVIIRIAIILIFLSGCCEAIYCKSNSYEIGEDGGMRCSNTLVYSDLPSAPEL
jgi:hypothetical protein